MTGVDQKGLDLASVAFNEAYEASMNGPTASLSVYRGVTAAITAYLSAALTPLKGSPVAWRWRLPSDTKWQFTDGPEIPRLGLPKSFEASTIKEPLFASQPLPEIGEKDPAATGEECECISMETCNCVDRTSYGRKIAALSPTAPELGAVKAHGMRLNEAHAAFHRACARSDALESTLRICRTFVISCRAEAKGCNQNRFDHTDELIGKIDEALAPAASQIDQPQTDEMQPDTYTAGDFNGVVRGKRP